MNIYINSILCYSFLKQRCFTNRNIFQGSGGGPIDGSRRQSEAPQKDSSPEPELELSDSEEEEDEEKKAERQARRLGREVKMMKTKLGRLKDKEKAAKKERENLREAMKKNQGLLKSVFCV